MRQKYKKTENKVFPMWKNKQGALLFPILFYLGVAILGFTTGAGIEVLFSDEESFLSDQTIATLQNSFVPQVTERSLANQSTYVERVLYPKPTDELTMSIGLLIVRWDDLGNAIGGINFSTIESGPAGNRSFFVTIAGNSTAIDPLNNDNCVTEIENSVNVSYTCAFTINIGDDSAGPNSPFNEVNLLSSSTNHIRLFNVVNIVPRQIPSSLATTDEIYSFYFQTSKTLWSLFLDVVTTIWLIIRILFTLTMIALLIFILFLVFRWITQ